MSSANARHLLGRRRMADADAQRASGSVVAQPPIACQHMRAPPCPMSRPSLTTPQDPSRSSAIMAAFLALHTRHREIAQVLGKARRGPQRQRSPASGTSCALISGLDCVCAGSASGAASLSRCMYRAKGRFCRCAERRRYQQHSRSRHEHPAPARRRRISRRASACRLPLSKRQRTRALGPADLVRGVNHQHIMRPAEAAIAGQACRTPCTASQISVCRPHSCTSSQRH